MKKEKYNISGMTCSACSAHVGSSLSKLKGVKDVNVQLLSNSMVVEYDDEILGDAEICAAVTKAGYGAMVVAEGGNQNNSSKQLKDAQSSEKREMKIRLIVSFGLMIPLMYIAMGGMIGLPMPWFFVGSENAVIFALTQLLLTLPVIIVNRKYYTIGLKNLFKMHPNMDTLIAVGSGASLVYGIIAIYVMSYGISTGNIDLVKIYMHDLYFETSVMILALVTLGKYLESVSKGKTTDAIEKLIDLAPKTAIRLLDGVEEEVNISLINVGDVLIIKPGGAIPVDGIVIEGNSSVNESALTGESIPVEKYVDCNVMSASINGSSMLKVAATKVGEDTTLSRIIKLVEEASNSKAPIAKIADKVSGVFVPIVMFISLLSFILWITVGSSSVNFALSIAIAVLVISCPCALGLATPVAIMVGTGVGASNGILIKSGETLQLAHKINTVVLDKTGTITEGKPVVTDVIATGELTKCELISIAKGLERYSEHPLASAINNYFYDEDCLDVFVDNFNSITGSGVQGDIDGVTYYAGNIRLIDSLNINTDWSKSVCDKLAYEGKTPLIFATEKMVIGVIAVADKVKDTSRAAIKKLTELGLEVIMLTGDNELTARSIARQVGADRVISEVLPADKEDVIAKLQAQGKVVAMVGDGVNDAPALARADVGIAIGSGMDIAIESSDIVLMKSDLIDVANAIKLSKRVINNIKGNLFWAFFYNIIGIPIAAGAFYSLGGFKLDPMIGAAAMSLSSVCVVLNALRLKLYKPYSADKYTEDNVLKINDNMEADSQNDYCNDIKISNDSKQDNENMNREENEKMKNLILIEGMMCGHCTGAVNEILTSMTGGNVSIDLAAKTATIIGGNIESDKITQAISNAGYSVISIIKE